MTKPRRKPSLPPLDGPTPEQIVKGGYESNERRARGDAVRYRNTACDALSRAYKRNVICQGMESAGRDFASLHALLWGSGVRSCLDDTVRGESVGSTAALVAATKKYKAGVAKLGMLREHVVRDVCVFDMDVGPNGGRRMRLLQQGLEMLCEVWGIQKGDA